MDAFTFATQPPEWTTHAVHSITFTCPKCNAVSRQAVGVWLNRRAPVVTHDYRRKWQEFYHCQCGCAWWAWSTDRPPSDLSKSSDKENHLEG